MGFTAHCKTVTTRKRFINVKKIVLENRSFRQNEIIKNEYGDKWCPLYGKYNFLCGCVFCLEAFKTLSPQHQSF